jgi:uridine kinase
MLNPECTLDYVHHKSVFESFQECGALGKKLGICNISDLNREVSNAKISELVRLSEAHYNRQLFDISAEIYENRKQIKLVLLAGPSSSGKTTSAKKIQTYLTSRGMNVIQLSTDDYFLNKEDRPVNEKGECDFESLYCVDLDLFNKQLMQLMDGKKVEIPSYNFLTGKREYNKNYVQLGEDDIIIVEGIHALNDMLTMSIDRKQKYKIYICPLVQINIDNHSHIHTSDLRKLRRIIRDSRTRGLGAADTLSLWGNIQRGEQQNIYPFQDEVDVVINSSLIYEVGVLKTYAEPLLFCVDEDNPVYPEALRLINFLRNVLPIPSDDIPQDSVLREFIGGSCFEK